MSLLRFCFVAVGIVAWMIPTWLHAQDIWEYSPYKVKIWISDSPSLQMSEGTKKEVFRRVADQAELHFGATWSVSVEQTPEVLFGNVLHRLSELSVDQLLARELILMIAKSEQADAAFIALSPKPTPDPKKKASKESSEEAEMMEKRAASLQSVRTLESVVQRISHIAIMPQPFASLQRDVLPFKSESPWSELSAIVKPFSGSKVELQQKLETGEVFAAFVQRNEMDSYKKVARAVPTRLPWQPESLLKNNDKIYLVSLDRLDEGIRIQIRELDSFIRRLGDVRTMDVLHPRDLGPGIAKLARDCFAPTVRIEENDFKTALLRVRAAGLVSHPDHPVQVGPGDVLQPIIRRDDSNGNPTVLQTIPFTYIAVTERVDEVSRLFGAIFTASRGALATAKNRRTQKVGVKVLPSKSTSELRLGIQNVPNAVFHGAEVFWRTPGTDDLHMLGRSDWRGALTIDVTENPTIQYEPPSESRVAAIANARSLSSSAIAEPAYQTHSVNTRIAKPNSTSEADAKTETKEKKYGEIKLTAPLHLFYVKNGETLLARLPIVTGLNVQERADLPDDRRRLEAEAFLKGLQNEILDLVVRRKILEARIKKELQADQPANAERLLDELKKIKSTDKLLEQIEAIQRKALSTDKGTVPTTVVKRIDKMVDATRQMIQKYLQDNLVRDLELELKKSK